MLKVQNQHYSISLKCYIHKGVNIIISSQIIQNIIVNCLVQVHQTKIGWLRDRHRSVGIALSVVTSK